jgi:hypothetical protein
LLLRPFRRLEFQGGFSTREYCCLQRVVLQGLNDTSTDFELLPRRSNLLLRRQRRVHDGRARDDGRRVLLFELWKEVEPGRGAVGRHSEVGGDPGQMRRPEKMRLLEMRDAMRCEDAEL